MMSRKVPNQSFEVFIFAVGGEEEEGKEGKEREKQTKIKQKQSGREETTPVLCREDGLHKVG